ncbi:MAG: UDP-3-O-[3-hydroxymyristoyl] N-acetylglucosamine deacetylase [Firmicutes bacterium]|nr:UDP-3-O-[3-hydroxymyristoyl] N-acetylglucosamine deacetylase [Bacillota bacterium]
MVSRQQTLAHTITYRGTGLHTGVRVNLKITPADPGTGIVFCRTDLIGQPCVKAEIANVVNTVRCTTLGVEGRFQIMTVEHLMAAFNGLGVDNAVVELDNGEVPVADGSAAVWVRLIQKAGIVQQEAEREELAITKPVWVESGRARLIALPAEELQVSYLFTSEHHLVGNQFGEYKVNSKTFIHEIAPARTLAFEHEIKHLREQGLALGGSLEIAVVIGEDRYLSQRRFPDEVVRHKALDLIGDLGLLGRVKGHIIGFRSGHSLNVALGHKILETIG